MIDPKRPEQIVLEAILGGLTLDEAQISVKVRAWHCPYCGTTSTSMEAASDHDGQCVQHPMAIKLAADVSAEREACAKIADEFLALATAARIRNRGKS